MIVTVMDVVCMYVCMCWCLAMRHFDNALRVNPSNELALFSAGTFIVRACHLIIEHMTSINGHGN
jgi:hypothetical protein